jgi:hypothetical protein
MLSARSLLSISLLINGAAFIVIKNGKEKKRYLFNLFTSISLLIDETAFSIIKNKKKESIICSIFYLSFY